MEPKKPLHRRLVAAAFTVALLALVSTSARAQVTNLEYRDALKVLSQANGDTPIDVFLEAFRVALSVDDAKALRTALAAHARYAPAVLQKQGTVPYMTLHGKAAGAFSAVKNDDSLKEFQRLLAKSPDWHSRLLLLDASAFSKPISLLDSCLTALRDPSPVVVRRSLFYLRKSKKAAVVDAIIKRYIELSTSKGKGPDRLQWERTLLVFQSTLREMLKVDLPSPEDYKNYFETRKDDSDLFDPKHAKGSEATRVTLFGAPITGKNLVFVLDISGSMTTTDPLPPGADDGRRGGTVVGDPAKDPEHLERLRDRQRMRRAKKELSNVVRSLPSDVRFNIITFASEVDPWKKSMVPASDGNKKEAVEYIAKLVPEGITFTDQALEDAFQDLEIDTIYLITDGAPTHVGTPPQTGPSSDRQAKPVDSDAIIADIHKRVGELNFLRGVRVFTLGFKDAEEDFLRKLAADHSGTYTRID